MKVICLCEDDGLESKIAQICERDSLKVYSKYQLLSDEDLSWCDVLVVDLKDCLLPSSTFFSPILTLTEIPTFEEAVAVLKCGAKGYGNRHMRETNLKHALESVHSGQMWLPPSIIRSLIDKVEVKEASSKDTLLQELSKREQEVALFVGKGMSNQQIADELFVSLRTVKAHLTSIYSKTGLQSRLELGLRLKG